MVVYGTGCYGIEIQLRTDTTKKYDISNIYREMKFGLKT